MAQPGRYGQAREVKSVTVPRKLVDSLRGQSAGLKPWLERIHKDLGLTVDYDGQTLRLTGAPVEILILAVETVDKWFGPIPGTEAVNILDKRKVVWRFHGDFVKVVYKFFLSELERAKQDPTVCVTYFPDEKNTTYIELSCDYNNYFSLESQVKPVVERLDKLHVEAVPIRRDREMTKARHYAAEMYTEPNVLCTLNEKTRRLMMYGSNKKDVQRLKLGYITP